jgi:hypothetical protein
VPGQQLLALDRLALLAREQRAGSTTAMPSPSSTRMSPGRIVAPPTTTGTSSSPTTFFAGPFGRTHRAQIGRPSSTSSSTSRIAPSTRIAAAPRTFACVASRSPISVCGRASGMVRTSTSPGWSPAIAACTMRLSCWPQTTVRAGPAARLPGTTRMKSASTWLAWPSAS